MPYKDYKEKVKTQQFTRRKPNLVKKADQLAQLCHADLTLIIRKNERYYTYQLTEHDSWPPTMKEINKTYPLPLNLLSRDFENIVQKDRKSQRPDDSLSPSINGPFAVSTANQSA